MRFNLQLGFVIILFFSVGLQSNKATVSKELLNEYFYNQNFIGKKELGKLLKSVKNPNNHVSVCQFKILSRIYIDSCGLFDSISNSRIVKYVPDSVMKVDEIIRKVAKLCTEFKFKNRILYNNDTIYMKTFYLILDYDCYKGWSINTPSPEYLNMKKMLRNVRLEYACQNR
jgi:hypothetical protein